MRCHSSTQVDLGDPGGRRKNIRDWSVKVRGATNLLLCARDSKEHINGTVTASI